MTTAVFRNTPSLSVPQTQNTAPVLEFNCLYTHDVRKKAKKWQDGMLRYHTFNKRVMVYDVPRNFIGDMHWAGDVDVQAGDELTLERCGVKVEVADCIGRTETDLSELIKSKTKNASSAEICTPARTAPAPVARTSTTGPGRANTQLKHRSLNALLGTPKGPMGKAQFPTRSPFDERHTNSENEAWEDGRPPKRPKTGEAWSVTRTTTTPNAAKPKEAPLWARTSNAAKQKKNVLQPGQQKLGTKEIIALSDDEEEPRPNDFLPGFSDDALANSSSPAKQKQKSATNPTARSSSPAFQTQRATPTGNRHAESSNSTSKTAKAKSGPDTHIAEISKVIPDNFGKGSTNSSKPRPLPSERPSSSKTGQTLRLAATAPRKRGLLCQDQLLKKTKKLDPPRTNNPIGPARDTVEEPEQESRPPSTAQRKLQAHLARIEQKGGSTSSVRLKQASKQAPIDKQATVDISSDSTLAGDTVQEGASTDVDKITMNSHEASALELRRLDDLMLPPPTPNSRPTTAIVKQTAQALREKSPRPPKENRSLRRAISDSHAMSQVRSKRVPGAPVRYTPSPTKRSRESTSVASRPTTPVPIPEKPDNKTLNPKRPFRKSVSLNTTSNGTSAVVVGGQFKAPSTKIVQPKDPESVNQDVGPWSRDAFDLFSWRPPGWDEQEWRVKEDSRESRLPPIGLSGGVSMPGI